MIKRTLLLSFAIALGFSNPIIAQPREPSDSDLPGDRVEESSQTGATLSLEHLVQEAIEQSPSVQAAQQLVEAKRTRILPATTLPQPTISFQHMGDAIPPTLQEGDPSSGRTFSAEQEIPFPGKLGLKGKMAEKEAEAEEWSYEQARRQVIADVKAAYYDLYFIYQSIGVVERDRELLRDFERIAASKYQVGAGGQQDVIKAQVEISKLVDRLTVLEQRKEIAEALINSILNRRPETPLGQPAEFRKAELRYTMAQLTELARDNSPKLKNQEKEIDRSQYAVELAKKEYYPDFSVGLNYVDRGELPEMYGFMVKAKIPLYFWRSQRQELKGSISSLSSARKQRESVFSTLSYEVKRGYTLATTSDRLIELYQTTLIPQARLALEASLASYQVGSTDFLTLLDSVVTLLEYELKYYEVLADYQKALAQLEPIVGVEAHPLKGEKNVLNRRS